MALGGCLDADFRVEYAFDPPASANNNWIISASSYTILLLHRHVKCIKTCWRTNLSWESNLVLIVLMTNENILSKRKRLLNIQTIVKNSFWLQGLFLNRPSNIWKENHRNYWRNKKKSIGFEDSRKTIKMNLFLASSSTFSKLMFYNDFLINCNLYTNFVQNLQ